MDDWRFDALARALGGASTRRSALGALAGMGLGLAGSAAREADAKKKRKKCEPACASGQTCRKGACTCDNGGAVCGASCCRTGQRCEGGACVDPAPQCLAAGAACKDTGRPCCDGRTCASGQGGKNDVACYVPAGGACATTADCVHFAACEGAVCVDRQPQPAPRCVVPTFAPTGDASANGRALRQAVAGARSGDTILLAPGNYQFDDPSGVAFGTVVSGLGIENATLTIERCGDDGVVTLVCPNGVQGNWACVLVSGGAASLTLRGISVDARESANLLGYGVYAYSGASVALEEVAITVAASRRDGIISVLGSASVTVRSGVSVTSTAATTTSGFGGLRQEATGSIACEAEVSFLGSFATERCAGVTDPACGCSG